jgi:aspartyl-tRNA(Asn)/glutamyl-tRNA(Gln) amidotransferase subunit A
MQHAIPAYYVIARPVRHAALWRRALAIRAGHYETCTKRRSRRVRRRVSASSVGTAAIRRLLRRLLPEAQKIHCLIKNDFVAAFSEVDVILSPTTPHLAGSGGNSDPVAAA